MIWSLHAELRAELVISFFAPVADLAFFPVKSGKVDAVLFKIVSTLLAELRFPFLLPAMETFRFPCRIVFLNIDLTTTRAETIPCLEVFDPRFNRAVVLLDGRRWMSEFGH